MRFQEIYERCWTGYRQAGMKKKGDRQVPNCVPVEEVKTGPEMTLNDLLYTAAAKAIHQAGLEGVPMDYEEAIKKAAKIYRIPYTPSELPRLLAQRDEIDRKLAMLKQGKQVAKARRQAKLAPTPAGSEEWFKTHSPVADRIKPPTRTLEETEAELAEDLKKWFKEKWVRFGPDGKIRGDCARGSESEGKPKCLPQSKAHALGKKGRASAAAKKRREDPNPERRGPAKNVATRVKEGFEYGNRVQHPKYGAGQIVKVYSNGVITVNFPNYPDPIDKKPGVQSNFAPGDKDYQSLKPVAEAQTDYQKRRQRERDVDMGKSVRPLPKNPKTDYQKRREQERRDMEMGETTEKSKTYYRIIFNGHPLDVLVDTMQQAQMIARKLEQKYGGQARVDHTVDVPKDLVEKQDACYRKVKSRYKVWPSAYASGALVQCRKKGAANWGNKSKK